jgi:hypothetical protein
MIKRYLYIDDERTPKTDKPWVIVRTSQEAIQYIETNGCPEYISFDHDLGGDDTAMNVVKWLVEQDIAEHGAFIPKDFEYNVHSANPIGAKNIDGFLKNYLDFKQKHTI